MRYWRLLCVGALIALGVSAWQLAPGGKSFVEDIKSVAVGAAHNIFWETNDLEDALEVSVARIIDGDGIIVSFVDGDSETIRHEEIRIDRYDTAEMDFRCDQERVLSIQHRQKLMEILPNKVFVRNVRRGKYSQTRFVADVYLPDGRHVAAVMLEQGAGRRYSGGPRLPWCPAISG